MQVTGLTVNTMSSKIKLVDQAVALLKFHSKKRKHSVKNMRSEVHRFEGEDR